jgi:hypothetical protein
MISGVTGTGRHPSDMPVVTTRARQNEGAQRQEYTNLIQGSLAFRSGADSSERNLARNNAEVAMGHLDGKPRIRY